MEYYLQGLFLGFAYLMPIGIQNMFVINIALKRSLYSSLLMALIVIFFDITLVWGCFFGIGLLLERLQWLKLLLLGFGGAAVIKIGYDLYIAPVMQYNTDTNISWGAIIKIACAVTWFNPQAIIDGSLLLGGVKASLPFYAGWSFVFGATSASCIWFLGLVLFTNICKNRFNNKAVRLMNRICGIMIMCYGIKLLYFLMNIFM